MRIIFFGRRLKTLAENFHRTIALGLENALYVYIKFRLGGDGVSMFSPCILLCKWLHTNTCTHTHLQRLNDRKIPTNITHTQTFYVCQSLTLCCLLFYSKCYVLETERMYIHTHTHTCTRAFMCVLVWDFIIVTVACISMCFVWIVESLIYPFFFCPIL